MEHMDQPCPKPITRSNNSCSKNLMTWLELMQPKNLNLKDLPTPLYHGQGSQFPFAKNNTHPR